MDRRGLQLSSLACLLLLLLLPACSTTRNTDSTSRNSTSGVDTASSDLESLYWARQDSARMRFTQADVDFMVGMISHHAQALIMARMAPQNGASGGVRTLSARIINAQNDEIETMQRWLQLRGQVVPEIEIDGIELTVHGGSEHGGHMMPGMLSPAQLEELAAARGLGFDRLFLQYMIQHHTGAVTMVDELFAQDGAGQDEAAFKIASDIHVDQITEIARMESMLSRLAGADNKP